MNKKGGSKIISIYWFVIILLVAGGIFAMVYSFYNYPYDVRELEGEVMINALANCISSEGKISDELFQEGKLIETSKNNFLDICHLNLNVEEDFEEEPQYYFEVYFYDATNLETPVSEISKGEGSLVADCNIQKEKEYLRTARCVEDEFFSYDDQGKLYLIKILSVIRKTEKNVR